MRAPRPRGPCQCQRGHHTTFSASADAYVSQDRPTTNFGSDAELRVAAPLNEQRTHLRFDVAGLDGTVLSAKLRLSPKGSSTTYAVHSVASTSWNEKTITWSTAPPLTAAVLATSAVAPDGWTEADVTSAVTTNGTITFGLDTTALNAVSLSSRETGALAPRPSS